LPPMIEAQDLCFSYKNSSDGAGEIPALRGVNLVVQNGEYVAIVGPNGSGKSTLAKLFNALLTPTAGSLRVAGMDAADPNLVWQVRQAAGMVFQNPDNQLVATQVEEDVAFGPENLGVPPEEIRRRISEALSVVGMQDCAHRAPHTLSGGQKQRVAIAGILAMKPRCMVLDEPTSMLDPAGRREVLETLRRLNRREGITVVHITHYMEEAAEADRVVVLADGRVAVEGTPREVFFRVDELERIGLAAPEITQLAHRLRAEGLDVPGDAVLIDELAVSLCRLSRSA